MEAAFEIVGFFLSVYTHTTLFAVRPNPFNVCLQIETESFTGCLGYGTEWDSIGRKGWLRVSASARLYG